jgi:hypothetical protein
VIRPPLVEFNKMEIDFGFDRARLFNNRSNGDDWGAFLALGVAARASKPIDKDEMREISLT